jgi:DNA-binding MarR family transcriptional regulator
MSLPDLVAEARLLAPALKRWSEALHEGVAGSAPMRAVLEELFRVGPAAVPAIARALGVTRQHVQLQVDALVDAGLAQRQDNPAHKRSSLIALTDKARALVQNIRAEERHALARLQTGFSDEAIADATRVLAACRAELVRAKTSS